MTAGAFDHTDHWPGHRHQDVVNADLRGLLDVEAGLREVLLESRHREQGEALACLLDTEAGLGGIVPAEPAAVHSAATSRDGVGAAALGEICPAERMSFRRIPRVRQAMAYADHGLLLQRAMDTYIVGDRTDSLALCDVLGELLGLAMDMAHSDWDRFRNDLEGASQMVIGLEQLTAGPRRQDASEAALAGLVSAAAQLAKHLLVTGYSQELLTTEGASLAAQIRLVRNEIAHGQGLLPADPAGMLRAARKDIADVVLQSYTWARRAIELRRGQALHAFDGSQVRALLEDFTTADLQQADLRGIDLTGVRWSLTGTRWPETLNVDDLRQRSDETPAGSGIYVVRSGTATVRDFVDYLR